jgi:hypothetical protein
MATGDEHLGTAHAFANRDEEPGVNAAIRTGLLAGAAALVAGCPSTPAPSGDYANRTDATNGGAAYVGRAACVQCHADIGAHHARSGHANALRPITGVGPTTATGETIAEPPAGMSWNDISWALGGFRKAARFFGADGYFLITGIEGVATQYNLSGQVVGQAGGYVPFEADRTEPLPFTYDVFRRFTTGPKPFDASAPMFEEGRPGFQGTWSEPGVQCEACHGPGGRHFSALGSQVRIHRSAIFVDPDGSQSCAMCHTSSFDPSDRTLHTADGYLAPFQQAAELKASGAHAAFACTVCHDPHASIATERATAIRNDCRACHADMNMALHAGKVFRRQDGYVEPLTCESCHMSFGVKQFASAEFGADRAGDTRTHLFRINTNAETFADATAGDGTLRRDAAGLAGMTVDRVCMRCHNEAVDGLFPLSLSRAAEIAPNVHLEFSP